MTYSLLFGEIWLVVCRGCRIQQQHRVWGALEQRLEVKVSRGTACENIEKSHDLLFTRSFAPAQIQVNITSLMA